MIFLSIQLECIQKKMKASKRRWIGTTTVVNKGFRTAVIFFKVKLETFFNSLTLIYSRNYCTKIIWKHCKYRIRAPQIISSVFFHILLQYNRHDEDKDAILRERGSFLIHPTDFSSLTDFANPKGVAASTFQADLNLIFNKTSKVLQAS